MVIKAFRPTGWTGHLNFWKGAITLFLSYHLSGGAERGACENANL